MQLLLQKVKVIDPSSRHDGQVVDILIKRGKILSIRKNIAPEGIKTVHVKGACLSPGWIDVGTQIGEPGYEHREDLESVSQAALRGGYTALAPFPNTQPVIDSASMVAYWVNKSQVLGIDIHPIAAVSKGAKGSDLAELVDMAASGAVAFSDGNHSLDNEGLLLRALQYARRFDGLVIDQPLNRSLVPDAQVHEGKSSALMGLKGQPSEAEFSRVKRNVDLLAYTGGKLLMHLISTGEAVNYIKSHKKEGMNLFASVGAHHLCFKDEDVESFDSQLKFDPPLRSKKDRKELVKALKKGIVSIISSQHTPLEEELKEQAFFDADAGALGLQTTFPMLMTHLKEDVDIYDIITALCHNAYDMLGLEVPTIEEDRLLNATLFHPDQNWTFSEEINQSLSKNTALFGKTFSGCVLGAFHKDRATWNADL